MGKEELDTYIQIVGIVSIYNPTKENITGLIKCAQRLEKLLIVDDSEDSYENFVRECIECCQDNEKEINNHIDYIWNCSNLGLAASVNRGIVKSINDYSPDWILLLDQDSQFGNDLVGVYKRYIKTLRDEEFRNIAIISPAYNYDRHKRRAHKGIKNIRFSMMSGSMLNVGLIKEIGLYDERLFIDCLDNEWCLRARRKGYRIVRCTDAVLDHHPAYTKEFRVLGTLLFKFGYDSPERYYYTFRSLMLIHDLYHDWYNDLWLIYKRFKSLFLFGDFSEYNRAYRDARNDYNLGFFGKYRDRFQ